MLSDTAIKNAKPAAKPYKLADSGGLYLFVQPNGGKYFRLNYRFEGKHKTLAIGTYPATSLAKARTARDTAKIQVADGIDPAAHKQGAKADKKAAIELQARIDSGEPLPNSFKEVALQWLGSLSDKNSQATKYKKLRRFENHIFPTLGNIGIAAIKASDVYQTIKPAIDKGEIETAQRLRAEIAAVLDYAIVHELAEYNQAQPVLKQIPAKKVKNRAAITDPKAVGRLLRDISNYQGTFTVQCAFRFSPLVFQRPGEIRQMLWADVDLDAGEWRPYISKTDFIHFVPLSSQAIAILKEIWPHTGRGKYVFPSVRGDGRPMSDNTIRTALRTLGYGSDVMVPHGFRSTASTLLNEQGWTPDAIERQLGHMPKDKIRAAYNRAEYLKERKTMMQAWADYLDGLKAGADVISINSRRA
ncbi:MAG: integrase arm-type DNA-binding domain-containing protein [Methyloglobulus sp.]|nr:integrase arm-type DNA-binding domain-containing protein [Methyloglobulus sp.]